MSDAPAPPAGASESSATTAAAAATADPGKAGAAGAKTPSAGAGSGEVDSLTTVGSMEELKKKAPEVYRMMMQGIATNIVNEMHRRDERLKKMWRENRSRAGIET
jgi:hypothetical protein